MSAIRLVAGAVLVATLGTLASCKFTSNSSSGDDSGSRPSEPDTPNILLVIMDDVGIDQLTNMGYGGKEAPSVPGLDALAAGGVRFRNTWSMPECSPGRSVLLTGRYPLRNNIYQAIGPNDLANSQIDPYEITAAKLLKSAGYTSAMFGKFHLAGPENNEAGNSTPTQLGWDYFYGWTGGLPGSIDTTAGGVAPAGTYSCGFVPAQGEPGGAHGGACYTPSQNGFSCQELSGLNAAGDPAGLQCLTLGGILDPHDNCQPQPPTNLVFNRENAHYVSPLVVNSDGAVDEATLTDTRGRGYRTSIEVDAARDWILARPEQGAPWMATLSFSAPHTPLQRPPASLLPSGISSNLTTQCADPVNQRRLSDAMIEAMDTELSRLLVETGIAQRNSEGGLDYDPQASNTLVVVIGDNGTFGPVVKLPFDPTRAKGTAYQTGIWVPLIVSGPMVTAPGRAVEHMINATDVFRLFGEVAELDVDAEVPRGVDGVSMLGYLTEADQASVREFNFAQGGLNMQANGGRNGPCVFAATCSHTPIGKGVCEDNGGVWWGVGADDPSILKKDLEQCWQVNQAIYANDSVNYEANRVPMGWTVYQAVRNDHFKLLRNRALDYDVATDSGVEVVSEELYLINQAAPLPLLDTDGRNLLAHRLSEKHHIQYDLLKAELDDILASQLTCPGDGNGDGIVDQRDLSNHARISSEWGQSSTYDFNSDGLTDSLDRQYILNNQGACPQA